MTMININHMQKLFAVIVGLFVLYTAATSPFEGITQRAIFLALVIPLGISLYPLGHGTSWRPLGLLIDSVMVVGCWIACAYVVVNYDMIMNTLPWATPADKAMTAILIITVLDMARRTVGGIFPVLVLLGLGYAIFGPYLPKSISHRGFDTSFVTETIFLGDLGIWGMLTGIAATIIAVFVLFGALLLHTGGGQSFMDFATRLGGRQPGGAAKIATIASGLFGTISGSSVANVATTGNFTIPMMIRLGYPRPFAAAVEAVASTGGQIAPPIMGTAAFIMAEILGISYLTIIVGAILPAALFYASVFMGVHHVAIKRRLAIVPVDEIPQWANILVLSRILPIVFAFGGLGIGIHLGKSIATSAFYGIIGLLIAYVGTHVTKISLGEMMKTFITALEDAGKGMVIVGILLAGAQILVTMINMTGIGVALSSLIVALAGNSAILVAIIVSLVCLIMGMGLPTSAAYILVSAVLAPAMTNVGIDQFQAHLFVFYYATISVITPPVCIAVFVGAGIAQVNWVPTANEAVRLAAVTYIIPFLILLYPGMTMNGGSFEIFHAIVAGGTLAMAVPLLLSGASVTASRLVDILLLIGVSGLAIYPSFAVSIGGAVMMVVLWILHKKRTPNPLA